MRVYLAAYGSASLFTGELIQGANLGWIVIKEDEIEINVSVPFIVAWHLMPDQD